MLHACIADQPSCRFLVARLQMEVVVENATSVNNIFRALDELPSDLDMMYESTLQRVNAQSPKRVAIARRVFLWVLYAREALSIRQLQCALCIDFEKQTFDPGDESPTPTIIALCGGLITVEKRGGVERVRFVRKSRRNEFTQSSQTRVAQTTRRGNTWKQCNSQLRSTAIPSSPYPALFIWIRTPRYTNQPLKWQGANSGTSGGTSDLAI